MTDTSLRTVYTETGRGQTLPEYLRRLRKGRGYGQKYVASQLNVTKQTYSHYETGRVRPPAAALYRLAGLYGVSPGELLAYAAGRHAGPVPGDGAQGADGGLPERQFLYYFRSLDERDRQDILSIMQTKMENRKGKAGRT